MNLRFCKGTLEDTEIFIQFLDEVREAMPQKECFYLDPPETVRQMMADGIMELWMVQDEDRLAAVFSVLYPGLHEYNYGYDLGLCEEELRKVIHMDTAAVHPDYRGLGLQARLVDLAERELSGQGKRILLSTVHPENRFSLNNMLRQGYVPQKLVKKYGSERCILRKENF